MSYNINYSVNLTKSHQGKTLAAQLVDDDGVDVGSEITTGFIEIGNGFYLWSYDMEDNFSGAAKFYEVGESSEILTFTAINPQEIENADIKTSDAQSSIEAKIDTQTVMSLDDLSNLLGLNEDR